MLYGTVSLVGGGSTWVIRCEPHVRSRLKRAFPRAPQQAADTIQISNNHENSRDLEWFLQRFPMEVTHPEELMASAEAHRDQESLIADLLAKRVPSLDLKIAGEPREHQVVVPSWLAARGGLLLGDEIGTGKTISALCCVRLPDALPATIVVPPHLIRHWGTFLARWLPEMKAGLVRHGSAAQFLRGRKWRSGIPDVFVISYFRLRTWADHLGALVKLLVFDECQQLRRTGSDVYRACEYTASKARYRLGLSATPIHGYGSEFFNVVDLLLPGCLGEHSEFIREWCTAGGGDKARLSNPKDFGAYLRREGIMLRRTRRDIGREMKKPLIVIHEIDSDATVIDKLKGDAVELAKVILASNERYRGEKMNAAGEFDALMRQATGIAKAGYVAEFVRLLLESGESVVLFGWHRAVYSIWLEKLKDFHPVMYTGSESPRQKAIAEDAFKNRQSPLMIMSLRAGAGVDGLQEVCRTVVIGELDWAPAVIKQNIGRVDRDGQTEPVDAYILVSDEGADPIMREVLGIKRDQSDGVIDPDADLVERADTGENNLRQLARAFLQRQGVALPPDPVVTELHEVTT